MFSSLALFMTRVFADHANHVLAFNDLARFTKSFYRGSHFHISRDEKRGVILRVVTCGEM
jgi:hypothetical protein